MEASSVQDWVVRSISEDFKRALKLINQDSALDPPEEPFRSLFEARGLLSGIQGKLKFYNPATCEEIEDVKLLNACVSLQLGVNYVNTEETPTGQRFLDQCLSTLEGVSDTTKTIPLSISCHNQLGVLWGNRSEHDKALEFLLKAKAAFESLQPNLEVPMTAEQWLSGEPKDESKRRALLDDLHTHTLFYLAQVYGHLKQPELSAQYCRDTLSRQLQAGRFDSVEWSLNCATLSQYFLGTRNFPQARHCLACAECVLQKHSANGGSSSQDDEEAANKLNQAAADVSRCWIKYAIGILQASKEDEVASGSDADVFTFPVVQVADKDSGVTAAAVQDYEMAKAVFLFGQKHVNRAKQFYTKDSYASDYVALLQEHSSLLKWLSCYEARDPVRCRMHKRRINMLTDVFDDLNPQHYLAVRREVMWEVAGAYSELVDLKIVIASQSPSPGQVAKINKLVQKSLQWYQKLYDSFIGSSGQLEVAQGNERLVVTTRLRMAKLVSKTIAFVPTTESASLKEALGHYQWVIKYCDSHQDCILSEELTACQDMVALLPLRIASLGE